MIDIDYLEACLPVEGLGEPLHVFSTIGSTNDEAKALAESGASHGTLVLADEQSKGRGRFDRKWHSKPGSGLALSLIMRPRSIPRVDTRLTVLGALSVVDILVERGVEAWIKWPNDVIVSEGKLAGVLVETSWHGDEMDYAIIGIGVNIRPSSIPRVELDYPATCVDHAVGESQNREDFLLDLIRTLGTWYRDVGSDELIQAWQRCLAFRNEQVILRGKESTTCGLLEGLDADGRLMIRLDSGETIVVSEGDLSLRPIDSKLD
jgi:BirA family biotin operon repressor/biotin-[acetyl-CoA-carboxylase] ligase